MRSMFSGGALHVSYPRATQQAFLEAHELGFAYFEGVFRRLRYDNLGSAVKRILRGRRREETGRVGAFRAHWRVGPRLFAPGGGDGKGGVEGEGGVVVRQPPGGGAAVGREGEGVARHERDYGRYREILELEHYLDVLEHKPGALAGSKPLAQWRAAGRWPASYDRLWQALIERHGKPAGTKEMI